MRSVTVDEMVTLHHYLCFDRVVGRVVTVSEKVVVVEVYQLGAELVSTPSKKFGTINIRPSDTCYTEEERVEHIAGKIRAHGVRISDSAVERVGRMYDHSMTDEEIMWMLLRQM